MEIAREVDRLVWNYVVHDGERIAGTYQSSVNELEARRDSFTAIVRQDATPAGLPQ